MIDEIGRAQEVAAARTCKNRGVRMVASAHGTLRTLLKDPELKGLLGGVEQVILSHGELSARNKVVQSRCKGVGRSKAGVEYKVSHKKSVAERRGGATLFFLAP